MRITLTNSELREPEILQALANEFRAPVVHGDGTGGLLIIVEGQKLDASYRDTEGKVIQRKLDLPRDKSAQLDTIALLSGNLARDEAGQLLAELRAEQDEAATLPEADLPEPPPLPGDAAEPEDAPAPESTETAAPTEENPKEASVPGEAASEEPGLKENRPELPIAELSAMAWPGASYPGNLDEKTNYVHVGAVYSELGSVRGVAANLLTLRNRGRGRDYAGEGAQMAVVWVGTDGYFRGFHGAAIAATGQGGIEGVQAAGVFTYQKNETQGAQLAGTASVSMSNIEGGQGAGVFAGTWGNVVGLQGAGAVSVVTGDLEGAQLSGGVSIIGGALDGFQLAMVNFAGEVDGFQLALANASQKKMDGFQLSLANYAGDVNGTQIGLLNIGGNVDGAQIGLVNVAKDVDGVAFAPVNVIPGIRNQIVAYGSWTPAPNVAGAAAGPLVHAGIKFMPEPFYTQLTFGIGPEAEECPGDLPPGDAGCTGNGVLYAPAFAVGGRGMLAAGLFTEIDVQYQYESAFNSSLANRHAVLGRAALGYDFGEKFGVFGGGGPRMDIPADSEGKYGAVTWSPHVFAGIQVF